MCGTLQKLFGRGLVLLVVVAGAAFFVRSNLPLNSGAGAVQATVETEPVASRGDAADDPAIWVHPKKGDLSTVIGTDKEAGGLVVYDLSGRQLQFVKMTGANNVDILDDFPFGQGRISLVVATNPVSRSLETFRVDPETRLLAPITAHSNRSDRQIVGVCTYRSPVTGRHYVFAVGRKGYVEQWEIKSVAAAVELRSVRRFALSSKSEGCVADNATAALYVSEELKGIWRFAAEPGAGSDGKLVDITEPGRGHLRADVEGLTIYDAGHGRGYLLASSQGSSRFVVYDRSSNGYVGTFRIGDGLVDGVSRTDGIAVTNRRLGASFPNGLFVAQDGRNFEAYVLRKHQNFKFVPWESIATKFAPRLAIHPQSAARLE
jgi:3-phytase